MSDRWGPSVVCIECGQAVSQIDMFYCGKCDKPMCADCLVCHECEDKNESN